MLQSLRKSVGSFVIKILFALLVLSFAVWGIGDSFFFGGNTGTVAEVGKREISVQALQDSFRNEMERLRRFNIDEEQARQLGVLDQVLERLIAVTLIEEAATDMGLVVGRSVIQGEIRKQLGQNVSSAELQARLRQAGISEAQYVDQLRRQVLNTEYQGSLATGAKAPKLLVDRLYEWRGEKRTASLLTVPVDPASPVADPTDEQLKTYYDGHPGDFTAPEYRAISYVFLDTKAAAAKTQVSEDRLREIYEERLSQFAVPERRTVLQMLVPDQATATRAMDKLRAGEDFAAVAKEVAGQEAGATELGTVTENELPDELAEAVFGLTKDTVSEPLKGPFGLQIVKVTAIEPGKTPTFEEVREELSKDAAEEQAVDAILETTNQLEEALGGGARLSEAADELNLKVHRIAAIDREGQDPQEKTVAGIPTAPFLQIAFETRVNEDSLLHETDENGFFILHVDSITAPALRPLDTVRAEVIDDWKSDQRWNAARETAEKIVERLNQGEKIADVAKEMGLDVTDSGGFTREGAGAPANISSSLVADLFAARSDGRAALADGVGGVNVAQLTAIEAAKPADDKQGVEQLTQSLDIGISSDLSAQLVIALRERYGVTVNQAAIQANFFHNAGYP